MASHGFAFFAQLTPTTGNNLPTRSWCQFFHQGGGACQEAHRSESGVRKGTLGSGVASGGGLADGERGVAVDTVDF